MSIAMGTTGVPIVRHSKPSNGKRLCLPQGQGHMWILRMLFPSLWSASNHCSVKKQRVTSLKRLQRLKPRNEKDENVDVRLLIASTFLAWDIHWLNGVGLGVTIGSGSSGKLGQAASSCFVGSGRVSPLYSLHSGLVRPRGKCVQAFVIKSSTCQNHIRAVVS